MTNTDTQGRDIHASSVLRMSPQDFAQWGVDVVAYIKLVDIVDDHGETTGESAYSIHAADGRHLGFAQNRDLAYAAITREDMEPVSVH